MQTDLHSPHGWYFSSSSFVSHPVIRLYCNEAVGGRGEQLCVQNELRSSVESFFFFFTWLWEMLLGNCPDCSPQGFNTSDCSVWLQIECGHTCGFVSFCQTVLQTMVWQSAFCLERGCHPYRSGFGTGHLSFLHNKYQTLFPPEWYSVPEHLIQPISHGSLMSRIAAALSHHSPIKCHREAMLLACYRHDPMHRSL